MFLRNYRVARLTALVVLASCAAAGADVITSVPGGAPLGQTGPLGTPKNWAHETFGQTIRTPSTDSVLTSFSLWLQRVDDHRQDDGVTAFRAYVMKWDEATTRAVGPILYQSDSEVGPASYDPFPKYTWDVGGLPLEPDQDYVLFLSIAGEVMTAEWNRTYLGYAFWNYADGHLIFQNDGDNFTTEPWVRAGGIVASADLAFDAVFVPEPASLALLTLSAVVVGGLRRRQGARRR